jgi:hypothetical protein
MNKPKILFKIFLLLLALSATGVWAQEKKEPQVYPSYEIVLQLLVASNNAGEKAALPPALSGVVKKLKINYSFSEYHLATTFLQRSSGSVEYKSLLSDFTGLKDNTAPVFSDWSLRNLRSIPQANGRNTIQIELFRFGARVPVVTNIKDENGKLAPGVNYEAIGISTIGLSFSENEPTVVGSLATSKPDELMFLVLTVKPAE